MRLKLARQMRFLWKGRPQSPLLSILRAGGLRPTEHRSGVEKMAAADYADELRKAQEHNEKEAREQAEKGWAWASTTTTPITRKCSPHGPIGGGSRPDWECGVYGGEAGMR